MEIILDHNEIEGIQEGINTIQCIIPGFSVVILTADIPLGIVIPRGF